MCEGRNKRPFHYPFETVELVAIDRKLIVLREASKFLLELRDDTVDRIIGALLAVDGLAMFLVGNTFGSNDIHGHL